MTTPDFDLVQRIQERLLAEVKAGKVEKREKAARVAFWKRMGAPMRRDVFPNFCALCGRTGLKTYEMLFVSTSAETAEIVCPGCVNLVNETEGQ